MVSGISGIVVVVVSVVVCCACAITGDSDAIGEQKEKQVLLLQNQKLLAQIAAHILSNLLW